MQYNIDVEIYTCIKIIMRMNVKKKRDFKYIIIIGVLAATGWFLFQRKPDVRSTTVTHTDGEYRLWVEVNANRWTIENREQFAEKLLKMVDENTFQKVHFSEDLEEPHCIIFRVYLMPYHSNWAFEVYCRKQKKDTHRWEIRVRENHL